MCLSSTSNTAVDVNLSLYLPITSQFSVSLDNCQSCTYPRWLLHVILSSSCGNLVWYIVMSTASWYHDQISFSFTFTEYLWQIAENNVIYKYQIQLQFHLLIVALTKVNQMLYVKKFKNLSIQIWQKTFCTFWITPHMTTGSLDFSLLILFITVCFYVCKALLITGWVAS